MPGLHGMSGHSGRHNKTSAGSGSLSSSWGSLLPVVDCNPYNGSYLFQEQDLADLEKRLFRDLLQPDAAGLFLPNKADEELMQFYRELDQGMVVPQSMDCFAGPSRAPVGQQSNLGPQLSLPRPGQVASLPIMPMLNRTSSSGSRPPSFASGSSCDSSFQMQIPLSAHMEARDTFNNCVGYPGSGTNLPAPRSSEYGYSAASLAPSVVQRQHPYTVADKDTYRRSDQLMPTIPPDLSCIYALPPLDGDWTFPEAPQPLPPPPRVLAEGQLSKAKSLLTTAQVAAPAAPAMVDRPLSNMPKVRCFSVPDLDITRPSSLSKSAPVPRIMPSTLHQDNEDDDEDSIGDEDGSASADSEDTAGGLGWALKKKRYQRKRDNMYIATVKQIVSTHKATGDEPHSNCRKRSTHGKPLKPRYDNEDQQANQLKVDNMKQYYHKPIRAAAAELSISLSCMKKTCRKLGILRWPHRKLQSLENVARNVENDPGLTETQKQGVLQHIKDNYDAIMDNPEELVSVPVHDLRQAQYKFRYEETKSHLADQHTKTKLPSVASWAAAYNRQEKPADN